VQKRLVALSAQPGRCAHFVELARRMTISTPEAIRHYLQFSALDRASR
jgi:hypothetical protein